MSVKHKELLQKMKEYDFIYDTKIGQVISKKRAEEDKEYIFKMLDLLYENYHRVRYVDDLSSSVIGKGAWAIMFSQKFAMMDKRIPIPQVPWHIKIEGKNDLSIRTKHAYYMLIGFFKDTDEEICVALNFKDKENRKIYKALIKDNALTK